MHNNIIKKLPYQTFEKKQIGVSIKEKISQINNPEEEKIVYEQTLCVTEENHFLNEINPIKLADIDWCSDYKLTKLLTH